MATEMSVKDLQAMALSQQQPVASGRPAPQENEPTPIVSSTRPARIPVIRTNRRQQTESEDYGEEVDTSGIVGELPKDPTMRRNIEAAAKARGISPAVLFAMVQQESSYNPKAYHPGTKASGLLQYIPASAAARKLDPFDPIASLAWGAKDYKEAFDQGGHEWALKMHFAGPDTSGHGPLTRRYVAEVTKRMNDIQSLLDAEGGVTPGNVVAGGSDVPVTNEDGVKVMSVADLQAMASGKKPTGKPVKLNAPPINPNEADKNPVEPGILDVAGGTLKEIWDNYPREYGRIWRKTKARFFNDENKEEVTMTRDQVDAATRGMNAADAKKVRENFEVIFPGLADNGAVIAKTGQRPREFTALLQRPSAEDIAEHEQGLMAEYTNAKIDKEQRGLIADFMRKIDHPTKLILRDNMGVNLIEGIFGHPSIAYEKMQEIKEIQQQNAIVNNPKAYSSEQVVAAQKAIAERKQLEEHPESMMQILGKIKEAAMRNPGSMIADFWNAIAKDPQLAMIPGGTGIKPIAAAEEAIQAARIARGARAATAAGRTAEAAATAGRTAEVAAGAATPAAAAAAQTGNTVSKAAKIADALIDPAVTGAATMTGIEEAAAFSEGRTPTTDERLATVLMGAAPGVLFGSLGIPRALGASSKARARVNGKTYEDILAEVNGDKQAAAATLKDALGSIAPADALAARIIINPAWWERLDLDPNMRASVEEALGIKNLSMEERVKAYNARQKELEGVFQDEAAMADYWRHFGNAKAAITELENAAAARAPHEAAAEAQHYGPQQEQRLADFQRNYDEALAAREQAARLGEEEAAYAERDLKDAAAKLDEEELFRASLEGAPAVRRAMNNAARRDSQLRMPKWQRGEVSPEVLATMGIGTLFAGTAFALSEPENKVRNAFLAGLAAVVVPKGGNIRGGNLAGKLKQAGAISADGHAFALANMIKDKKLAPDRTIAEAVARDAELVSLAKQGKQDAINTLFQENYPGLVRHARRYTKGSHIDAEDIVQEAFARVFSAPKGELPAIHKFSPNEQFNTWMKKVVENRALDAIDAANTLKRGGDVEVESLNRPTNDKFGEETTKDALEEGAGADFDTPEYQAMRADYRRISADVIRQLPDNQQYAYLLHKGEGKTFAQVSEMTGIPPGSVGSLIARTDEKIVAQLRRRFSGEDTAGKTKRSAGEVKGQAGKFSPTDTAKLLAVAGAGATAAYTAYRMNQGKTDREDRKWGKSFFEYDPKYRSPLIAGLSAAGLMALIATSKGRGRTWQRTRIRQKGFFEGNVKGNIVPISTELRFKAAPIFKAFQNFEMMTRKRTTELSERVIPFAKEMRRMAPEALKAFERALFTGDGRVTKAMMEAFNNPKLVEGYKAVRSVLDSLGDELRARNMIPKDLKFEHFPRRVKDYKGLLEAIGTKKADHLKAILDEANEKSIRETGHPLNDIARDRIINQELYGDSAVNPLAANQAGYAKNRVIEEITPELLPYYHSAEESLFSYIREAVEDLEKVKAFGDSAVMSKKGGLEVLDTAKSIDKLVNDLVEKGKIKPEHAEEIGDLLRSRFEGGEFPEPEWINRLKDVGNAYYLGNFLSAGANLTDLVVQALYVQGMVPTLKAVVRQATGRKLVSTKQLGITHVSSEFSSQAATAKWASRWMRLHIFNFLDATTKNSSLNAALIKGRKLAQSESGVARLANRYQEIFGDDFSKLINDLKSGKHTNDTDLFSWMELARTQPISKLELPPNYHNNPNLRFSWWLRSFAIKQMDLLHTDARLEMRKGTPAGIAKGSRNLIHAGIILGLAGASLKFIQQWILTGKPPEDMSWQDIPLNMFRTMGFSEMSLKEAWGVSREEAAAARKAGDKKARAREAKPVEAVLSQVAPPYRGFQDAIVGKPEVVMKAMPWANKWIIEQARQNEEELRKREKR